MRIRTGRGVVAILAGLLAAFPLAGAAANQPPRISGTPASTATTGIAYVFQPTASDPERRPLRFSISNKPSWAQFNTGTGRLSGTPGRRNVGTTSGIVIRVSDGRLSTALPAFSIRVTSTTNRAPTISGTPSSSARIGVAYVFAPSASDPDGDAITWSIAGRPSGASFNLSTGRLSWTPTTAGTWSGIVVTATDSRGAAVSLPAFSITVAAAPASGSAALGWQAPTRYVDGTTLPPSDLAAYRIYRGSSATALTRIAEVDARTISFTVPNLATGTHYFAVTAVTINGVESALSAVGSKTIP